MRGRLRLWKSILTLALLVVWLPATAHCRLEALGIIPVDQCCEADDDGRAHSDGACSDVEVSSLKTECTATLPVPRDSFVLLTSLCVLANPVVSDEHILTQAEFLTHHLPQFVITTAQPIRGPSLVS